MRSRPSVIGDWILNRTAQRWKSVNWTRIQGFRQSVPVLFRLRYVAHRFDVKSLATIYLDKPLKAHTLMQTIARANRVCDGKSNGLIVDYIGVVMLSARLSQITPMAKEMVTEMILRRTRMNSSRRFLIPLPLLISSWVSTISL